MTPSLCRYYFSIKIYGQSLKDVSSHRSYLTLPSGAILRKADSLLMATMLTTLYFHIRIQCRRYRNLPLRSLRHPLVSMED